MKSIDLFVKNWGSKQAMLPLEKQDIEALETELTAVLPDSYKYLISTYGLVHTPNVMTKTVDLNVEVSDVRDFLSLDDVLSLSKLYEMSGMPKGHILFASDCDGNMFCFKLAECQHKQTNVPVWFYNHALCTIEKVSNSFSDWLAQFNPLEEG
ncbi:SMI1/KNR4 family protein [Colwellia psychrerythraea]|uniref:Cell wall assembly/cell proliferation coordinating protein, KNR4-like protein n=1 Tax=Colwellia psychrerythraea TaxID=28229 RepID=A0A099KV24_COLPS|nr:SMI1/KNR4 family protein [Colwellia psychrerythraea]KGJ93677.1 Cell wall assembly/cell proliferation coordinating protein, KNR4-like protein [Colwellia psychrerythraea]